MLTIQSFTFNPFEENTYVVSDASGACIIIDPGCYTEDEKRILENYISKNKLKPEKILLTHAHIDHILGNNFLSGKYNIPLQMSATETGMLSAAPSYGEMWGIAVEPSSAPSLFVEENVNIRFGITELEVLFTPGHSPGSFSFVHSPTRNVFSGDVLFMQSIGRTDLPGGNYETLMQSIKEKLLTLDDNYIVLPGHGPSTTIGDERKNNPFLKADYFFADP